MEKKITLKPITKDNIEQVLALKVNENQKSFVITTAESLAKAYVYYKTAWPFAVYQDEMLVGFIMMGYYEEKKYYTLWEFLIDGKYQGKGYGRKALLLGIQFLRDTFHAKEIYTGVAPENLIAKKLYMSVGFAETGLCENGMEELRLAFLP